MMVDGSLAGIGKRESVADVARVLGRQASVIVWRTYAQTALEEMAEHAGVPVVNALTDEFHPCQLLADLLTIREHKGELAGLTVAFVGDGACNMGNSWLLAGATAGLHVRIARPEGHQPEEQYVARAREIGADDRRLGRGDDRPRGGGRRRRRRRHRHLGVDGQGGGGRRPAGGVRGLHGHRRPAGAAPSPDAIVLHCLPAYRGKEIDADVLDGPQSVVWDEAENRRHAQKAIITWLLRGRDRGGARMTEAARRPVDQERPAPADRRAAGRPRGALADRARRAARPSAASQVTQATLSRDLVELDAVSVRAAVRRAGLRRTGRGRRPPPGRARRDRGRRRTGWPAAAPSCCQRRRQRQPRGAAHPARRRPVPRLGASTRPSSPTSSAPSPATTPCW